MKLFAKFFILSILFCSASAIASTPVTGFITEAEANVSIVISLVITMSGLAFGLRTITKWLGM